MRKPIKIHLEELIEEGIIDSSTAHKITDYYQTKSANTPNRVLLAFGLLGAVLIGLGIILIVAHNWDNFPRLVKNFLAFLPMLIGQVTCAYTLWKKPDQIVWRESSSVFLVFAIGVCIATISQTYNIQGDLGSFLLTWLLLGLPLVYIMNSSAVNLLYIGGVVWYTLVSGFDGNNQPLICWGLFALAFPHYYQLWRNQFNSNFFNIHSWAIAIAGLILLATWGRLEERWLAVAYMSGLAIYYLVGKLFFSQKKTRHNPYLLIGTIGTIGTFLFYSFRDNWQYFIAKDWAFASSPYQREFWIAILLSLIAIGLLFRFSKGKRNWSPLAFGFSLFLILFLIAFQQPILAVIASNLFVLTVGIFYIFEGHQQNSLAQLNLGLLTLSILIIARFLDIDLSFIARGVLFIIMGIGFFWANYQLVKKGE